MAKLNCWEYKKCGREKGGSKAAELGICPCYPDHGRDCWFVAGTLCGGKIQGTYAQKLTNCWRCDFMNAVKKEEDPATFGFSATRLGMEKSIEKQRFGPGATKHDHVVVVRRRHHWNHRIRAVAIEFPPLRLEVI